MSFLSSGLKCYKWNVNTFLETEEGRGFVEREKHPTTDEETGDGLCQKGVPMQEVGENGQVQREAEKALALSGVKRRVDSHTALQPRKPTSSSPP